jgi:hypothetical protein
VSDPIFPAEALSEALHWAQFFGDEWAHEFPEAVAPSWPKDFAAMLAVGNGPPTSASLRTSHVMRKLRRVSPRGYEILLRTMIHGESLSDTTAWLNERAIRNKIPLPAGRGENYSLKDTVAMFIAAVDFVRTYF